MSDGQNRLMMQGVNGDIISCWHKCYKEFKNQPDTIGLLEELKASNADINAKCEAIFGHMVTYTNYKLDREGEQLIKSPGRFLTDGYGDCKSYTMFIASCLHGLGIPHIVRFVNFDGGRQYTHVYPVAIDENGNEIIMDACELNEAGTPIYNYARRFAKKKDFYYGK